MQTSQAIVSAVKSSPSPNPRVAARARIVENDPRWAQVRARDATADGRFFYSVETTGVYCRPSCAARPARPENVRFHETSADAERAGFRACKRCRPAHGEGGDRGPARIAAMCRLIDESESVPTLAVLAAHVGLSAFHAHRLFKAGTGLTPRGYAKARRRTRVVSEIVTAPTVTQAIYDAGYGSSGRFYEEANALLGMTPSELRAGGEALPVRFAVGECSLGSILVASTGRGVCAVLLGDDPEALIRDLEQRFPRAELIGADAGFETHAATVIAVVERSADGHAKLPLDIRGTAFQQRVWQALTTIPRGKTITYSELARMVGSPKAIRAVARACAANALAVVVPCHRVVRRGGDLAGYRWGVDRKRALLQREREDGTPSYCAAAGRVVGALMETSSATSSTAASGTRVRPSRTSR